VKAFPSLTLSKPVPGSRSSVTHKADATATHIVFFTGLDKIFVPITDGEVEVPKDLSGQVYALATSSSTEVTDSTTVAGPTILLFERDSNDNLIS